MSPINKEIGEIKGINYEVAFPKFHYYKEQIEKDLSKIKVRDLIWYIQSIDTRAVALYYCREGGSIKNTSHKKLSILTKKVQELVYSKDGWIKNDSPLLKTALIAIIEDMLSEVEIFLNDWDVEQSWENLEITLALANDSEDQIKTKQQVATFVPMHNDYRDEYIRDISRKLSQATENNWIIKGFQNINIEWFDFDIKDLVHRSKIAVSNIILSPLRLRDRIYKYGDGFFWFLLDVSLAAGITYGSITGGNDYIDGHFWNIESLIQQESSISGEWEWERKYAIIQESVFPIIAEWIYTMNSEWKNIDYSDWTNTTFFMSRNCLAIDGRWIETSNTIIWDRYVDWTIMRDWREVDNVKIRCSMSQSMLTELWVWDSLDFLYDVINHPESVLEIRKLSQTLNFED